MIKLLGAHTENLNLSITKLVGTLLFEEFPSTIVFCDNENNPIIKEWVDCTESGDTNRYFYFRTTRLFLKNFINGTMSHQDLILNSLDGLLYFQDIQQSNSIDNFVISSKQLPKQYRPSSDFYFDINDGVDVTQVYTFFNLDNVLIKKQTTVDTIKEIASLKKTEIINLHLKQGSGVGFGTVNTDILGKTLMKFDKFYKEIALDYYKGKNRGGEISLTAKEKKQLAPCITTEIFGSIAASYSVMLRPKMSQYHLYLESTETEIIAQRIFSLVNNSNLLDTLKEEYLIHSDFTINSFKGFLKEIYEMQLDLEINWVSPITPHEFEEELNYKIANKILDNINNLNIESDESFEKIGKFRGINCDTGHFIFVSHDQEQFTGYFDKQIREGSEQINFINLYKIKIERKIIKELGQVNAKINDTIIAFYDET